MKRNCEDCEFWNATGPRGAPNMRFEGTGRFQERMWARLCQRMPEPIWKYRDDWCGEYEARS